tara:strand:- start:465 stop:788 length:324 start_codon:yes stop_codon:yes gene_type:complete
MSKQKNNSHTEQTTQRKFVFVESDKEEHTCIKLTGGKFDGVIYKYGKVGFAGSENPDGTMPLKFDYTVLKNPKDAETLDNQEFINYIGDILIEVMDENLKNGTAILK